MKYDKEGWQCFVRIGKDKVIKKIKTKEEISISIKRNLEPIGQLDKLEEKTGKLHLSTIKSLEIIEKSSIPEKYLATAKIKDNLIEQDKVVLIGERINNLIEEKNEKEAKKIIVRLIDFIIELWKYKIHENTYKFDSNYGIDKKGDIVLIDFLEITDDKEKVRKQIINKKWAKPEKYLGKMDKNIVNYLIKLENTKLTLGVLEENWNMEKIK